MNKKKNIGAIVALCLAISAWVVLNPPGRFGWSCFAYTTFGAIPRPISDIQVCADGSLRNVDKTHNLNYEAIEWLFDPMPDVLIIATGWHGVTKPRDEIKELDSCEVRILQSDEARRLYNELREAGKKVAIHYHSTC